LEKIKAEVSRLKIALQQHLEKMENDVPELISEKELHSIIG
jgi:hypothetical protein